MSDITRYMRVTKSTRGHTHSTKSVHAASNDKRASSSAHCTASPTPSSTTRQAHEAALPSPQSPELLDDDGKHVPAFIYEASHNDEVNVIKYVRKGQPGAARASEQVRRVVQHIESHFCVPADFERSHKYGPHSGLTFDTRLARAYAHELLAPKPGPAPAPMCLTCAQLGHTHRTCPDGF